MAAINTDNLVNDFIVNTKEIFEDNMSSLGLKEIYTEDVVLVPVVPSLALSCISMWNDVRSISSANVRYEMTLIGDFWYYHSAMSEDIKRNLIMRKGYEVAKFIMEHASLNGFLTNTRALVRNCSYAPRVRSGVLMASARIIVAAPYQLRLSSVS